jgi:cytoskeletal protein CcmA (bactofilin family)
MSTYGYAPYPDAATPQPNTALFSVSGDFAAIEGKFKINDSLHIECEIGGELDVGGRLVIGESGVVNADVRTVDALIMGTFSGTLMATGNVEIAATGKVSGNIKTDSLVITKGGFFTGSVARIDHPKERETPALEWKLEGKKQELVSVVVEEFRDRLDDVEDSVSLEPPVKPKQALDPPAKSRQISA